MSNGIADTVKDGHSLRVMVVPDPEWGANGVAPMSPDQSQLVLVMRDVAYRLHDSGFRVFDGVATSGDNEEIYRQRLDRGNLVKLISTRQPAVDLAVFVSLFSYPPKRQVRNGEVFNKFDGEIDIRVLQVYSGETLARVMSGFGSFRPKPTIAGRCTSTCRAEILGKEFRWYAAKLLNILLVDLGRRIGQCGSERPYRLDVRGYDALDVNSLFGTINGVNCGINVKLASARSGSEEYVLWTGANPLELLRRLREVTSEGNDSSADVTFANGKFVVDRVSPRQETDTINPAMRWRGPDETSRPTFNRQPVDLAAYQKKNAIVIGISDYAHLPPPNGASRRLNLRDLQFAINDAAAIAEFLADPMRSGHGWQIESLLGGEATTESIVLAVEETLSLAEDGDLILLYFAGHAIRSPYHANDVYLMSFDTDPVKYFGGVNYSWLRNKIRSTRARHVIVIVDSCLSGVAYGARGDYDSDILLNLGTVPETKLVFSAVTGAGNAFEDKELGHGVFTYYLLKGLYGAAPDHYRDNVVSLGELEAFVSEQVKKHTIKHPKMELQRPQLSPHGSAYAPWFPIAVRGK